MSATKKTSHNWTRSETLALAQQSCTFCFGLGLTTRWGRSAPCNCVFRAIFRACYDRFRHCIAKEKYICRVEIVGDRRATWGMKDEEYVADFCLVTKRTLTKSEHRIFRYHYLLGADWKLCCTKLDMERGDFYHKIYRIEEKLGRIFRELQPHSLFPVDDYFNQRGEKKETTMLEILTRFEEAHVEPESNAKGMQRAVLKFPIRKTA